MTIYPYEIELTGLALNLIGDGEPAAAADEIAAELEHDNWAALMSEPPEPAIIPVRR